MFELLADALKALAGYPPIAAGAGLAIIVGGGVWLLMRGERDRKANDSTQGMPAWTMYGPVHDAMQSLHHISEQGRDRNKILERCEGLLQDVAKEQREQTQLLEIIRNESRLR